MIAYVVRVPSLRELIKRGRHTLKTIHASTLSYVIRRLSTLTLARCFVDQLAALGRPQGDELVALDSMAISLPRSRRGCTPINAYARGGGVLWSYRVDAPRGAHPIQILKITAGPWSDTKTVGQADLVAGGPVYLMDRGFWALDLVGDWIDRDVRFILRVSAHDFQFRTIRLVGPKRTLADGTCIEYDGIARLGGPHRKTHPTVRLVYARRANGDDIILISDRWYWNAQRLLDAYRRRWETERFHKFLKSTIGMTHYFSFQQKGLELVLHVVVLLAMLLFLAHNAVDGSNSIDTFYQSIAAIRDRLGVMQPWKSNSSRHTYGTRSRSRPKRPRFPKIH